MDWPKLQPQEVQHKGERNSMNCDDDDDRKEASVGI